MRPYGYKVLIVTLASIAVMPASAAETDEWLEDIGLKKPTKTAAAVPEQFKSTEPSAPQLPTARRPLADNDRAFIGEETAEKLSAFGEKNLNAHNFDKAIGMFERALDMENDVHTRCLYAEALEGKMKTVTARDPALFNRCVKQWFYVFKHSDFQEDSKRASAHLKELTGKAPTLVSLPQTYLPGVLVPETDDPITPEPPVEPPQVY